MRILSFIFALLLTFNSVSRAQYPIYPDSAYTNDINYIDAGIGTYGFEVGVSGQPVGNWGGALFLRGYPGPKGTLYQLDSDYLAGAKVKYYGLLPDGFYGGGLIGATLFKAIRPWAGVALGYDYYTRFRERSEFKNIHIGVDLQAGMDTEGDGFIGVGVRFGVGFKDDDTPFGNH